MSTLLLCHMSNPHRPPDWRWQLAKYLQENKLKLQRSQSDNYICWAKKFAIEIDNAADEWAQFLIAERSPAIYNAWALYKSSQLKNARWELEARILARESRAEITRKMGLNSAIVDHYLSIFFDVESRLSHPTYVTHAVIGDAAKRGISEREPDVLWKMFGYWRGADLLDLLICRFTPAMKPKSSADIACVSGRRHSPTTAVEVGHCNPLVADQLADADRGNEPLLADDRAREERRRRRGRQ